MMYAQMYMTIKYTCVHVCVCVAWVHVYVLRHAGMEGIRE